MHWGSKFSCGRLKLLLPQQNRNLQRYGGGNGKEFSRMERKLNNAGGLNIPAHIYTYTYTHTYIYTHSFTSIHIFIYARINIHITYTNVHLHNMAVWGTAAECKWACCCRYRSVAAASQNCREWKARSRKSPHPHGIKAGVNFFFGIRWGYAKGTHLLFSFNCLRTAGRATWWQITKNERWNGMFLIYLVHFPRF